MKISHGSDIKNKNFVRINQVEYKEKRELKKRIKNRILGGIMLILTVGGLVIPLIQILQN